jgi:hypothetical protein
MYGDKTIDCRLVQYSKQLFPILVILSGNSMDTIGDPAKQAVGKLVIPFSIIIFCKLGQLPNAL